MGSDELRQQLTHAAERFPVRGWTQELQRRVVRRRRIRAGIAVAVGVVAAATVAVVGITVAGWSPGPDRSAAPTATADADYVGSSWRLTSVTQGADATAIPAGIGARMDLLPDGRILIDNGVNALSGRFMKSATGFDVRDVGTTFVLYDGNDPHRLAAIAALNTLAYGNREGVTPSSPARDTVLSADRTHLVVQAGAFRLSFERIGPATAGPDLPASPGTSS